MKANYYLVLHIYLNEYVKGAVQAASGNFLPLRLHFVKGRWLRIP